MRHTQGEALSGGASVVVVDRNLDAAEAVDIAKVVAFLAGPDSGWVTGQAIATDGGVSLRVEPKIFAGEQWTRSALAEVVAAREGSDETSTGTERRAAR